MIYRSATNINSGCYNTIAGGLSSKIRNSKFSSVGGGTKNYVTGACYTVIGGGYCNTASQGSHVVLGGGAFNLVGVNGAVLVWGQQNTNFAADSFIGGGYLNNNLFSNSGGILGGNNNTLTSSNSSFIIGSNLSATNVPGYTFTNNMSAQRQLRAGGSLTVGDGNPGNGDATILGDLSTTGNILSGGVNLTNIIQSVALSGTSNFTTQVGTHGDLTLDVAKGQIIGATEFIQFVTNVPDASNPNEDVLGTEDYQKLSGPFEFKSAS